MKITDKAGFERATSIRPLYGREAYEAIEKCVDSMGDIKILYSAPGVDQGLYNQLCVEAFGHLESAISEVFDA